MWIIRDSKKARFERFILWPFSYQGLQIKWVSHFIYLMNYIPNSLAKHEVTKPRRHKGCKMLNLSWFFRAFVFWCLGVDVDYMAVPNRRWINTQFIIALNYITNRYMDTGKTGNRMSAPRICLGAQASLPAIHYAFSILCVSFAYDSCYEDTLWIAGRDACAPRRVLRAG